MGSRGRLLVTLTLLVALTGAGTLAAWQAVVTVHPSPVRAGTLDLTVDGDLSGPGGSHAVASLGLADAVPGEGVARVVTVANAGSTDFLLTGTGTATGGLAPSLLVAVHPGGAAANSGTAAAGTRRGSCTGQPSYGPAPLTSAATPVLGSGSKLVAGASRAVCVVLTVSGGAPSSQQGQAGRVQLRLDATQVRAS